MRCRSRDELDCFFCWFFFRFSWPSCFISYRTRDAFRGFVVVVVVLKERRRPQGALEGRHPINKCRVYRVLPSFFFLLSRQGVQGRHELHRPAESFVSVEEDARRMGAAHPGRPLRVPVPLRRSRLPVQYSSFSTPRLLLLFCFSGVDPVDPSPAAIPTPLAAFLVWQ